MGSLQDNKLFSLFIDLGNLVEIVVHYLSIKGMACLGCQDGVFMVNALMYMITYWARPTVNHDLSSSGCHDSPSYYMSDSQP